MDKLILSHYVNCVEFRTLRDFSDSLSKLLYEMSLAEENKDSCFNPYVYQALKILYSEITESLSFKYLDLSLHHEFHYERDKY